MQKQNASINGRDTAYWAAGQGNPLVLLHGFAGDHRGLLGLAEQFPDRKVIIPDLPGFGESQPLDDLSFESYAGWLNDFLRTLKLGPVELIGHSYGATVALATAAGYPQTFDSLSLLNPLTSAGRMYALGAHLTWKPVIYWSDRLVAHTRDKTVIRRIIAEDYQNFARADRRTLAQSLRAYRSFDALTVGRQIKTPTHIIGAKGDMVVKPRQLRKLAEQIPAAQLQILPGGHFLPIEEPATTAVVIKSLLAK